MSNGMTIIVLIVEKGGRVMIEDRLCSHEEQAEFDKKRNYIMTEKVEEIQELSKEVEHLANIWAGRRDESESLGVTYTFSARGLQHFAEKLGNLTGGGDYHHHCEDCGKIWSKEK